MSDEKKPTQITTTLFWSWASNILISHLQKDGGKSGITAELEEVIHHQVRKPDALNTQRPIKPTRMALFI
ncbi:MAG: hypothetical protein GY820_18785 [Gammaproteobacteria bacterium]|nr:hypothetical protein [Gammaproteobacteria bacterium]